MRSLRFIFIALITFLFVTNVVFLRRTLSVLLCGVLSFNSASCYSFLDNYEKADAAAPVSRTFALSNSTSSDTDVVPRQKQKVAGCLFGVCVDLPKIPVSISGIPGGDQKEPIQQANPQSNVSLAGKWQSDWGLVEFNSNLTGHWNQGSGIGQIKDGTYDPKTRKLVFHYYQPWNDMNGTATLTLSEDGNRLLGTWTQQRASNPPGSGGSGGWTMTRDPSQQSVGDARKPLDGKLTIVSLAGKWQSNWGLVEFNSDLSGRWNQGVGIGQIKDGTYDPQTRKLVFHYYQPWNDMNGTATLTLSEDGNRLSGNWTQQRGSNPSGSGGSGGWVMTRNPSNEIGKADDKEPLPEPGDVVMYQTSAFHWSPGRCTDQGCTPPQIPPPAQSYYPHVAVIIEGGVEPNSDGTVTITRVRSKWNGGAIYDHDPNGTDYGKIWTIWRRNNKLNNCKAEKCNWLDREPCGDPFNRQCFKTDKQTKIYPGKIDLNVHPITSEHPLPGVDRVELPPTKNNYDCRGFVFGHREQSISERFNLENQVQEILDDGYTQLHAKDTEGNMHYY